jgi:hypothetical protein
LLGGTGKKAILNLKQKKNKQKRISRTILYTAFNQRHLGKSLIKDFIVFHKFTDEPRCRNTS